MSSDMVFVLTNNSVKMLINMKRTPISKKSKTKLSTLKKKLWVIVSQRIRERDKGVCFTCKKSGLSGSGYHGGHMYPDASCGALLRYHPLNLAGQCYYCNINLGGRGAEFLEAAHIKYGEEVLNNLRILRNKSIKADEIFYFKLTELYQKENWQDEVIKYLSTL